MLIDHHEPLPEGIATNVMDTLDILFSTRRSLGMANLKRGLDHSGALAWIHLDQNEWHRESPFVFHALCAAISEHAIRIAINAWK
jgi:hypothetical protein